MAVSKGDETRSGILAAAGQLAGQVGLDGLTIGGLATRTGLSKSGLFAHFGSKESLQLQVHTFNVERFTAEVIRPALREARGEPRVRALFERWLSWAVGLRRLPDPGRQLRVRRPARARCAIGSCATSGTGWTPSPWSSPAASPRATSDPTPIRASSPRTSRA